MNFIFENTWRYFTSAYNYIKNHVSNLFWKPHFHKTDFKVNISPIFIVFSPNYAKLFKFSFLKSLVNCDTLVIEKNLWIINWGKYTYSENVTIRILRVNFTMPTDEIILKWCEKNDKQVCILQYDIHKKGPTNNVAVSFF